MEAMEKAGMQNFQPEIENLLNGNFLLDWIRLTIIYLVSF